MNKIKKFKYPIIAILFLIFLYIFLNNVVGSDKLSSLKSLLDEDQKTFIKKYILPYKYISELEKNNANLNQINPQFRKEYSTNFSILELLFIEKGNDIEIEEGTFKLSNNKDFKKFKLKNGFYSGINNITPGTGYLDFHNNNLFLLSARGILSFIDKNKINSENSFKQIKNNINNFISINQFSKNKWFSIKDLKINNDKIFVSFTEEFKENCWNTSIIYAEINYVSIDFKKLFSADECVDSEDNIDNEFNAYQSGGRIINLDNENVLLSIGDYRSRHLAQNKNSINGKIININLKTFDYKIASMGHRNPQGLFFDKTNNFILETEHGPMGGDEINLIYLEDIKNEKELNFGWPIASAGEHYGGKNKDNERKYEKYPLHNSHSNHGFIEPLISFVPSIAISEVDNNKYIVSSLKDKSLYSFELDINKQIINLNRIEVYERIRDLLFYDEKIYLFLEDSASIAVIPLSSI